MRLFVLVAVVVVVVVEGSGQSIYIAMLYGNNPAGKALAGNLYTKMVGLLCVLEKGLGGGFKYLFLSPLLGEDSHFD